MADEKTSEMCNLLDGVTQVAFGRSRTDSISSGTCVTCGGPATEFCDEASRKEYSVSGMCQKCQDAVFGGEW